MRSVLDRLPLTIRHYYEFGPHQELVGPDLIRPAAWDAIRHAKGPFAVSKNAQEFDEAAAQSGPRDRARRIAAIIDRVAARRVCSYGVGTGIIERALLAERPDLELVCTDFAPRTVKRLRALLPTVSVLEHDLAAEGPLDGDLHLLHRIDSDFSDDALSRVLAQIDRPALLVATQLLDVPSLIGEVRRRLAGTATRAGFVRTEAALVRLWRSTHVHERLDFGELTAYLLLPRQARRPPSPGPDRPRLAE